MDLALSKVLINPRFLSKIRNFPRKPREFSPFAPRSKRSSFQDFGRFAEPTRLLQATEIEFLGKITAETVIDTSKIDELSSFYILQIRTSGEFGSDLSGENVGILISLIDEKGNSILQRIPAVSEDLEGLCFQRGSIDVLGFRGPKLGQIEALWVGLESGSWRLDGIKLRVIGRNESTIMQYDFEADDGLIGDRGGSAMIELRPKLAKESSSDAINEDLFQESRNVAISVEETMAEYSDLKLSLLVYNSLFVVFGTAAVAGIGNDDQAAYAFLAGGVCGFVYLLFLQRSVDGLSTSLEGKFKGSFWQLAVILMAAAIVIKVRDVEGGFVLMPGQLFAGLAGFLTYKLAVILAAFMPLNFVPKNQREL